MRSITEGADVVRETQLLRGDQYEFHVRVADQRLDQRVHRASEFQVAAQADREIAEASLQGADRQQVGQRLRRVLVAAVSGVDDRDARFHGRDERGALLRMPHRADVRVAGDDPDRVRDALALGSGAGIGRRKTKYAAP